MSRIPIAIVGLNFGRHIIENIVNGDASNYFRLAAVCDLDAAKAAECGKRFGVRSEADLDKLLAEPDIPCIGLFTGPAGRARLLRRILDAGKDVMTTKPFERDADAALEILRYAESKGRVLHLNSPAPSLSPDLACVMEWHRAHDLGGAVACQMSTWVRYHEQAGEPGDWQDDPEKCPLAPIFRLGIYLINDMVSLFGEAERVTVLASRLFGGRPTPDNAQLGIRFRNGAIGTISSNFCCEDGDHYRDCMQLHYERGTIYRNSGPQRADHVPADMSLVMGSPQIARRIVEHRQIDVVSGSYQWEAFAKAHRGEAIVTHTRPEHIAAGLRIIEAMSAADRGDGSAAVQPVNSAEASVR